MTEITTHLGQYDAGISEGLRRAADIIDSHMIVYGCPGSTTIQPKKEGFWSTEQSMWIEFLRKKANEHDRI